MSFGFACVGANRGLFETPATATPKAPRRGRSYNLSSGVRCLSPIVFGHGGCQERTRGGVAKFSYSGVNRALMTARRGARNGLLGDAFVLLQSTIGV